jgi:hypothetical protein
MPLEIGQQPCYALTHATCCCVNRSALWGDPKCMQHVRYSCCCDIRAAAAAVTAAGSSPQHDHHVLAALQQLCFQSMY